jgi:hypothetical protein
MKPALHKWGGDHLGIPDRWAFGYMTGPDDDLVCTKPNIATSEEAELCLSPVRLSPEEAELEFKLAQK